MKKLLQFELRKLFKMKSLYICLLICIGSLVLTISTTKLIYDSFLDNFLPPNSFEMVRSSISSSNLIIISCIFTTLYVCDDFSNGTIKNICSKGYTRTNIYLSKYIISTLIIIIFSIVSMIFTYIFGLILWNNHVNVSSLELISILVQILIMIAYNTFFFTISYKFEKTGTGIALNLVGPIVITLMTILIDELLKIDNFSINSYWIESLFLPLQQGEIKLDKIITPIITSIIYILGLGFINYQISKKKQF